MSQNWSETSDSGDDIGRKAFSAGFWNALSSGATRVFSLIQTVVVARLLYPSDLGLMGMASLALWTLHVFTQPGIEAAIIYRRELDDRVAGTAWTISVCRGAALFGLLWVSAPWIAGFFREARLTALVRGMAAVLLIDGLANIWVVHFQKELDFKRQAIFDQLSQAASVVITLVAVVAMRDVWALVIGRLGGAVVRTVSSYGFSLPRPAWRWNREVARELMGYGRHIMGINILLFFLTQGDNAFVGRVLGTEALGFYGLAYGLSNLPGTFVSSALSRITFPLYAKLREDRPQMALAYRNILEITGLLTVPLCGALIVLAPEVVSFIYGARWLPAMPCMRILCVFGLIRALNTSMGALLQALGLPSRLERIGAWQLILMAAIITPLGRAFGIAGVGLCVTLAGGFSMALILRDIRRDAGFPARAWLAAQRTPFLGTCAAVVVVLLAGLALPNAPAGVRLAALGLLGAAVYAGCVYRAPSTRSHIRAAAGYIREGIRPFGGR